MRFARPVVVGIDRDVGVVEKGAAAAPVPRSANDDLQREDDMRLRTMRSLTLLVLALPLGACAAAAVAGAGAATGIYLTSRGANAVVDGSLPVVARRTDEVFSQLGIEVTERTIAGDSSHLELKGKTSTGEDVDAKLKRESATTTAVEVTVKKNPVVWDRDYAKMIVERIVTAR